MANSRPEFRNSWRQLAYPCCTFRGSIVALDSRSGAIFWKTFDLFQYSAACIFEYDNR
jgi:hypothetical protein